MTALLAILFCIAAGSAIAHGTSGPAAPAWTIDPWIVTPLMGSAAACLLGIARLWRRAGTGQGVGFWQAASFATGWLALALALLSPLHQLGHGLFTAHMVEHTIIMIVAAPLIALSRPFDAMLWALPPTWRPRIGALTRMARRSRAWRLVGNMASATLLQAFAIWAWHMPALYNTVLVSDAMHRLQHLSFFLTALLFWWTLFYTRGRAAHGLAVFCLFVTTLHTGFLGVLLTVSRQLWYTGQAQLTPQWGLTPLEDQQLAGLVMWVPAGVLYTVAALALASVWIGSGSDRNARSSHALAR